MGWTVKYDKSANDRCWKVLGICVYFLLCDGRKKPLMPQRYIKNDSGFLQGCFLLFWRWGRLPVAEGKFSIRKAFTTSWSAFGVREEDFIKTFFAKVKQLFSAVTGRRKEGEPPRKEAVRVRKSPDCSVLNKPVFCTQTEKGARKRASHTLSFLIFPLKQAL